MMRDLGNIYEERPDNISEDMLEQSARERAIFGEMAETQRKTGLKISWVSSAYELTRAGDQGLYKTYCDIFAEPPYYERFTQNEVCDYFSFMLEAGGLIFAADNDAGLAAFAVSIPLTAKPAVVPVVAPYVNPEQTAYFAEDAVIPGQRRRGISRAMKSLLLNCNRICGFETMVLRTSSESDIQAAAVAQLGGRRIPDLSQDVDSIKLDGSVRPDRRVFFTFNLAQPPRKIICLTHNKSMPA